ncbi:MAG: hypothetical protein RMJ43_13590 [Chloroherpetonaceae bacterium]|nr:hypothetical protein [Chthonomonadaceae bacterium]MDW8208862.1 hypothetical protein [Chloroherpetonaceae bacterium]
MIGKYRVATAVMVAAFVLVWLASYYGWGVPSEAQAQARSRSVRMGSLHTRTYYGGGPGFGK